MVFEPNHQRFVIVALTDCSVVIDGKMIVLKGGEFTEELGEVSLKLAPAGDTTPILVLVNILSSSQPLTIKSTKLEPQQQLEDASDRNRTLLIALSDLLLRDERDLAEEGEPWRSSPARRIRLRSGNVVWLRHGMHRVQNTGNASARYITIEW
jgi:hypothetical protein